MSSTLLNFVPDLPSEGVAFVEQQLQRVGCTRAVMLQEQTDLPGHVCLVGWDEAYRPVRYVLLATLFADPQYQPALAREIQHFLAVINAPR